VSQRDPGERTHHLGPSKGRVSLIAGLVLAFLLILGTLGYRWALKGGLATLIDLDGTPERDSSQKIEQWISAEEGDEFYGGDGARTAAAEVAVFRLSNGARLTLKPRSKIRFQTKRDRNSLGITVEMGEADVQTSSGALTIDSEFGPIQIHANSKLALKRNKGRLAVGVELGSISLGSEGRRVEQGEHVDLELGGVVLDPEQEKKEPVPSPAAAPEQAADALNLGDGVSSADLQVAAGASFTVHDPRPPTRIGIDLSQVCSGKPARLSSGRQKTEALGTARLSFGAGRHDYQVHCLDGPKRVAASGTIAIVKDAGTRNLPTFAPSAQVATDGRQYTVLYQHRLPQVNISWPNAPQAASYTLQVGSRTISTSSPNYSFSNLARGTHQVTFSAATNPPRRSRTTTISVVYDTQAPAALVSIPPAGYESGSTVDVAGQALPGWTVSVEGKELEVDSQRRFSTHIKPDSSLPIAFSHPSLGTHYYLRRSKSSSP